MPGVNQILQVVTDFYGGVVQDGADEVVFVIIIIITGVGFTEGAGPLVGGTSLGRGSLGAALLLHAEHQVVLHDVCCCVDNKRGE